MKIAMIGADLTVRGGITTVEKLMLDNPPKGVSFIHLPTFTHGSLLHNTMVYWTSVVKLAGLILMNKIDGVHIHFSDRGSMIRKVLPCLIAFMLQRPVVFHSHCAFHREFYAAIPWIARALLSAIYRRSACFISLSKSWDVYFTECLKLRPGRHCVLYNPVIIPSAIPNRSDNRIVTFVFIGAIGTRRGVKSQAGVIASPKKSLFPGQDKGSFDCIRALAKLPKTERIKSRLILAGDGDIAGARALASELEITPFISIRPWLSPHRRDELLKASDVFILPSFHEGLPMSMLEAMAFALPVIVTPVGGIPEIITDEKEGIFVSPGNIEELTEAMKRMIIYDDRRNEMGRQGRMRVEPLRVEIFAECLGAIYREHIR